MWCCIIKETTDSANLVVFPSRLHLTYLLLARLPPTFWLFAILLCVVLSPPPQKKNTILTPPPKQITQPRCRTVGNTFHLKPCHTPNPFHPSPLLSPQPYTIIHAPIWCRGRSPSTGPRAACSLSGIPSGSCSAYATTWSGLSSTPPRQQLRVRPDLGVIIRA